ncbi:MAG TPA: phosphate transport system regulatory protein PhoU [Nitrospiraceae bacterium]|nr:MAG: phosphate transport system regulatory protein PhoU [Nitrospirae bacterium GWA2_46_11]OGW25785.1 MAG: phosphate transport system regulatory protein PhoU [Nitrospirae bacterium GWB2_47_37]HCZ12538.1 phosphate transport system regulatory protein PhoU [Nitrospiraceae bacterium]
MAILDAELMHLKELVLKMGAMVEGSIRDSVNALVERNDELANVVIERDHQVNTLDVQIDEECIRLLALMQPMAGDLRFITTAMKITTDLERMGDNAVNIAERALELNKEPILKPYIDIPNMSRIAQGMTRDALDAFVRRDKKLATEVIMRDDEVDDLKYGIFEELISYMVKDSNTVSRAMRVSFVAQYLERIADHATNIAEMVIYLVAGKIIRHMAPPMEE